jgi:CBS domain containing-hemolysin-like protein
LEKVRPGRLAFWADDPDGALAVILLGNNLVNVGVGFLATALAMDARAWGLPIRWGNLLFPGAAAVLVIVFGEIIPKVAARFASEKLALTLAPLFQVITISLSPLVQGLADATGRLADRLSGRIKAAGSWDPHVIRQMLETSTLSRAARSVVTGLLDFGGRSLVGIMIPREEVFSIDLSLPREEVVRRVIRSGYSRVPVHRGGLDAASGALFAKDLLAAARESELLVLDDLVRPLPRVPVATPLPEILRRFREGRFHMALVVDAGGRVRGLVTLQDLLEAIVGPVAEEPSLKSL